MQEWLKVVHYLIHSSNSWFEQLLFYKLDRMHRKEDKRVIKSQSENIDLESTLFQIERKIQKWPI